MIQDEIFPSSVKEEIMKDSQRIWTMQDQQGSRMKDQQGREVEEMERQGGRQPSKTK